MRTSIQVSPASAAPWDSQPASPGEKLVVVSDSAADTQNLVIAGTVSGSPSSETVNMGALVNGGSDNGKVETETSATFEDVVSAVTTAANGTISIRGQGIAAEGDITVSTVPTEGQTLILGLVGFTKTYTFRSPCRATITAPAGGGGALVTGAAAGSYVTVTLNGTTKYFWFSNGTTTDPAPGGTGYAVVFTGGDSQATISTALYDSIVANMTAFAASHASPTITITGVALGAITIAQDAGADFTLTTVAAGTASAANQIRTGYHTNGVAASTQNIADYIDRTIDAAGTAGTHYGTGTVAHHHLTASYSLSTTDITDRIACSRLLGWYTTNNGSAVTSGNLLLRNPVGGANGTLIGEIAVAGTAVMDGFSLDNESLADDVLPPVATITFDAVRVGGCAFRVFVKQEIAGSDVTFTIYGGISGSTLMASALGTVVTNSSTGEMVVSDLLQGYEHIKLVATHANTAARKVFAFVVIGT